MPPNFDELKKAAESGNTDALYQVARLLLTQKDVGSLQYYRQAADKGHPEAAEIAATHLHEGILADRDPVAAVNYLQTASDYYFKSYDNFNSAYARLELFAYEIIQRPAYYINSPLQLKTLKLTGDYDEKNLIPDLFHFLRKYRQLETLVLNNRQMGGYFVRGWFQKTSHIETLSDILGGYPTLEWLSLCNTGMDKKDSLALGGLLETLPKIRRFEYSTEVLDEDAGRLLLQHAEHARQRSELLDGKIPVDGYAARIKQIQDLLTEGNAEHISWADVYDISRGIVRLFITTDSRNGILSKKQSHTQYEQLQRRSRTALKALKNIDHETRSGETDWTKLYGLLTESMKTFMGEGSVAPDLHEKLWLTKWLHALGAVHQYHLALRDKEEDTDTWDDDAVFDAEVREDWECSWNKSIGQALTTECESSAPEVRWFTELQPALQDMAGKQDWNGLRFYLGPELNHPDLSRKVAAQQWCLYKAHMSKLMYACALKTFDDYYAWLNHRIIFAGPESTDMPRAFLQAKRSFQKNCQMPAGFGRWIKEEKDSDSFVVKEKLRKTHLDRVWAGWERKQCAELMSQAFEGLSGYIERLSGEHAGNVRSLQAGLLEDQRDAVLGEIRQCDSDRKALEKLRTSHDRQTACLDREKTVQNRLLDEWKRWCLEQVREYRVFAGNWLQNQDNYKNLEAFLFVDNQRVMRDSDIVDSIIHFRIRHPLLFVHSGFTAGLTQKMLLPDRLRFADMMGRHFVPAVSESLLNVGIKMLSGMEQSAMAPYLDGIAKPELVEMLNTIACKSEAERHLCREMLSLPCMKNVNDGKHVSNVLKKMIAALTVAACLQQDDGILFDIVDDRADARIPSCLTWEELKSAGLDGLYERFIQGIQSGKLVPLGGNPAFGDVFTLKKAEDAFVKFSHAGIQTVLPADVEPAPARPQTAESLLSRGFFGGIFSESVPEEKEQVEQKERRYTFF